MNKPIKYKERMSDKVIIEEVKTTLKISAKKSKEEKKVANTTNPQKDLEVKSFENLISINHDKVNLGNIESELWKKNIGSGPRTNRDYLDVSSEDFTKNTSVSIEGKEITPSSKIIT